MERIDPSIVSCYQEQEETPENWCKYLFLRLEKNHGVQNMVLFIKYEEELNLCASQTQSVFTFYPDFKPVQSYTGYSIN